MVVSVDVARVAELLLTMLAVLLASTTATVPTMLLPATVPARTNSLATLARPSTRRLATCALRTQLALVVPAVVDAAATTTDTTASARTALRSTAAVRSLVDAALLAARAASVEDTKRSLTYP